GPPGGRGEDRSGFPPTRGRHRRELPDPRHGRGVAQAAVRRRGTGTGQGLPLDARFDSMADVDEATKNDKRWNKYPIYAIKEVVDAVGQEFGGIDILVHSIAFRREL